MLLVRDIRLPLSATKEDAVQQALRLAKIPVGAVGQAEIAKISVDARSSGELLEGVDQVVAAVRMDLDGHGFGEVEAENAEDGFCVDDVFFAPEIDLVGVLLDDADKVFDVLRHLQGNFDGFHESDLLFWFSIL